MKADDEKGASGIPSAALPAAWRTTPQAARRWLQAFAHLPDVAVLLSELLDEVVMQTIKGVEAAQKAGIPWRNYDDTRPEAARGLGPALSCKSCDDPDLGPRSPDEMRHCAGCYAVLENERDALLKHVRSFAEATKYALRRFGDDYPSRTAALAAALEDYEGSPFTLPAPEKKA